MANEDFGAFRKFISNAGLPVVRSRIIVFPVLETTITTPIFLFLNFISVNIGGKPIS